MQNVNAIKSAIKSALKQVLITKYFIRILLLKSVSFFYLVIFILMGVLITGDCG